MRTNRASREGFAPNTGYHRTKTYAGKKVSWRSAPEGVFALIIIGLVGDGAVGSGVEMERDFAAQGAGASTIFKALTGCCPWVAAWYAAERGDGSGLSPRITWNRYHKMYYANEAETRQQRGRRSREHYMYDPRLRPYVPAVEKLYKRGGAIPRDVAVQAVSSKLF